MKSISNPTRRCVSLLMAVILLLGVPPLSASAAPPESSGPAGSGQTVEPAGQGTNFDKFFNFDLSTTSLVQVELSCPREEGVGFSVLLYIVDANGNVVSPYRVSGGRPYGDYVNVWSHMSASDAEAYPNYWIGNMWFKLQPGQYYVHIWTNDRQSAYKFPKGTFTLSTSSIPDDTNGEPNDDMSESKLVNLGDAIVGNIGYPGHKTELGGIRRDELDRYRFELDRDNINLEVVYELTESHVGVPSTRGRVIDFSPASVKDNEVYDHYTRYITEGVCEGRLLIPGVRSGTHCLTFYSNIETEYTATVIEIPGHTVTLSASLDGEPLTDPTGKLQLGYQPSYSTDSRDERIAYEVSVGNGTATFQNVMDGTYNLYYSEYNNPGKKLCTITVDGGNVDQDINCYTVKRSAIAGTGATGATITSTYNGSTVANNAVILGGGRFTATAVGIGAATYSYEWTGDIAGNSGTNGAELVIENVSSPINAVCTVTGHSGEEPPPPSGHTITIDPSMENGSVTVQGGLTEARQGDTVRLTVTPDADYRLAAGSLKYNTTPITGSSFVMPDEAVTIYAEFEPIPATPSVSQSSVSMTEGESATFVVYLGNGADAADSVTVTSTNGDIATATPTNIVATGSPVTVTGHSAGTATISLGWSGGTLDGQTSTVDVEVTAKSQPSVNYTVTFDPNGGTRTGGGELVQTVPAGGSATAPIVTRDGYTFTGWDRSFSNVQAEMTVKANWSRDSGGSPSGGDSSGGSSDRDTSTWSTTVTSDTDMPVTATVSIPSTADKNGNLSATVTEAMVRDAITKAQAEATRLGKTDDGIIVELNITAAGGKSLAIKLDDTAIGRLNTAGAGVSVKSEIFRFALDVAAVKQVHVQSGGAVTFSAVPTDKLSATAQAAIGNRPVYDFTLTDNTGKTIISYGKGTITRGISYTPASGEKIGNLIAVKVLDSGNIQWITESSYNNGWLIWSGDSNSIYGVGYKTPAPAFTDTGSHWAKDSIDFVVSRGLFSGTSATTFSPDTAITRGMFVTALGRLSGQDVSGYKTSSFADVKAGSYYLPYIEWAVEHQIVSGIGNNQFAPDRSITREEMAVMIYNYAKATNYTLPNSRSAVTYTDNAQISTWAATAVKALQQAGVVSGVGDGKFNPKGTATRAEAATILRNFVEGIIDESTTRGWAKNEAGQWMYWTWDGKLRTGWLNVTTGSRYYMDENGIMVSGKWMQIGGKWYYFYTDGKLATSTTIDGYEVDADGARKD